MANTFGREHALLVARPLWRFAELNSRLSPSIMTMPAPANVDLTTILLVDDDDQSRKFCRDCLTEYGFRVLEGDCGLEALLAAANYDGAIDVLITDLEMPRINGVDLAVLFKEIWPAMSVLFISGSPSESIRGDLGFEYTFLPKPFLPGALLKTIAQVLETRPSHPVGQHARRSHDIA